MRRRLIAKYWFLTSWAGWITKPGPMQKVFMKVPKVFAAFLNY